MNAPRRRPRYGIWIAFAVVVLLAIGAYIAAAEIADELVHSRAGDPEEGVPESVDHTYRPEVRDGITLDVWVLDPEADKPEGAVDTALILHGKADRKRSMAGLARRFAKAGVRAVLVDMRGHGRSTDTELTYGVEERRDLSALLDWFEGEGIDLGSIGVYGPSYGGAVALQLAGTDPRIDRVVAVAAFRSFPDIAHALLELPPWAIEGVVMASGFEAGFRPDDASPERHITATEADVILLYSWDDEIVPFAHGQAVARACGEHCRLIPMDDFDHLGSLSNPIVRAELHQHLVGVPYTGH